MTNSAHTFHIPVMGTGFTIDTPLHVAKFGISSAVSLLDDGLVELIRKHHTQAIGEEFEPIGANVPDSRAKRITAYLDLLDRLVKAQVEEVRNAPFESDSDIDKYFRMLPDCPERQKYFAMTEEQDAAKKEQLQSELREVIAPGSIDVNIMSKVDRDVTDKEGNPIPDMSEAMAALRGFANSSLNASVVLSAGFNPRVYGHIADFPDFYPDENGKIKKRITLKVSDFRSAHIQAKYLAKRGLWVSEYRVESGLNCGGHAFSEKGHLMGPVLEEFKDRREDFLAEISKQYFRALEKAGRKTFDGAPAVYFTAQGGIGTHDEDCFLRKHYRLDGTGWGTPFLLVPESTNVDEEHLEKLMKADDDIYLSETSSPLNIPFWNLRSSASEEERRSRVEAGTPGSVCPKQHAKLNYEFGIPLCTSSREYVRRKIEQLEELSLPECKFNDLYEMIIEKSCICRDLGGAALRKLGIMPDAKPAICAGPNIRFFDRLATLEEMTSHIYGRLSLLCSKERPHMFLQEISINVERLRYEAEMIYKEVSERTHENLVVIRENLLAGIEYYQKLVSEGVLNVGNDFLEALMSLRQEIEAVPVPVES